EKEMKVAMTLTVAKSIREISSDSLVQNAEALQTFDELKQNNAA
ncbi:L-lactate dehydrogenase, partial [Klebsiella pneumoniae]|nr:L-lactate dehydrogenase [Klebsiella pneumoniae]